MASESKDGGEGVSISSSIIRDIDGVASVLRRRTTKSSIVVAKTVVKLILKIVESVDDATISQVIATLKSVGRKLSEAYPLELVVGNMVRRVLFFVREEAGKLDVGPVEPTSPAALPSKVPKLGSRSLSIGSFSLQTVLTAGADAAETAKALASPFKEVKEPVLDAIEELVAELDNTFVPLQEQAPDHVSASDVILTFGHSSSVLKFLTAAAEAKRTCEVILVEAGPGLEGHSMAKSLSEIEGITVTVVPDAAIFAIMARVNKVILGTRAVMANGGLLAQSGAHTIAVAAKHYNVPVVVVAGLFKLCPLFAHDQQTFNELEAPAAIAKFKDAELGASAAEVEVLNPAVDYVPPHLVSLLITSEPGAPPSYVYRLIQQFYSPDDTTL